ncbi:MAG: hypothetical protein V1872_05240 [bacterium]
MIQMQRITFLYVLCFLYILSGSYVLSGCTNKRIKKTLSPPKSFQETQESTSFSKDLSYPELQTLPSIKLREEGELPIFQTEGEEKIFSLTLKEADIKDTLLALTNKTGLNIVVDPDVTGTITVDLNQVTLFKALEAILPTIELEYEKHEDYIHIFKPKLERKMFKLDYVSTSRDGSGQVQASIGGSSSSSISTSDKMDIWADIGEGIKEFLSEKGKVSINKSSGFIVVTDYKRALKQIEDYLQYVNETIIRQVLIEAKILEITLKNEYKMGIDFDYVTNWTANIFKMKDPLSIGLEQALAPSNEAFQIKASGSDFNSLLDALATQGTINVLSSPRISTLNNQKAVIKVAREDVFWKVAVDINDETKMRTETITAEPVTIGIVLDVTPQISTEGVIIMSIHPTITELFATSTSPQGATAPIIDVRETSTVVTVQDGQTVIVGGLMTDKRKDTTHSIPCLGDLPLLGSLFSQTDQAVDKIELVILLTPKIVTKENIEDITSEYLARIKNLDKSLTFGRSKPVKYDLKKNKFIWEDKD